MKYYKRTQEPDVLNPCYNTLPQDAMHFEDNSVLPNCIGYLIGRIIEIYGSQMGFVGVNGDKIFDYNTKNCGWLILDKPVLGAVVCWQGHGGIVEDYDSINFTFSQSHYNGIRFDVEKMKIGSDYHGMKFQGFIVPKMMNWENEPNVPRGTFPPFLPNDFYRIRKNWNDEKSQVGAYHYLEVAKSDLHNYYKGYHIYTPNGVMVE